MPTIPQQQSQSQYQPEIKQLITQRIYNDK